jgi:hypothetical protein
MQAKKAAPGMPDAGLPQNMEILLRISEFFEPWRWIAEAHLHGSKNSKHLEDIFVSGE